MLDLVHTDIYPNDELKHWGILGMKWGIRRFQNPDGSLTPEGRERYLKVGSKGKTTLTEEGYKQFFNKERNESSSGKTRNIAAVVAPVALGTGIGALTSPAGPASGAMAGGVLGSVISMIGAVQMIDPQSNFNKGLTQEGAEFLYNTKTGNLKNEVKDLILDDTTFLTDLGQRWIQEQYSESVYGDVKSSPEYKIKNLMNERSQEIFTYWYKNIYPICKDMPVSLYLAEQKKSSNPSKEYKAYEKYLKEINKKYYNRAMKALGDENEITYYVRAK